MVKRWINWTFLRFKTLKNSKSPLNKTFAVYVPNKGFIAKIPRTLPQINKKKTGNPIEYG